MKKRIILLTLLTAILLAFPAEAVSWKGTEWNGSTRG